MKIMVTADWHMNFHKNIFPSPDIRKLRCIQAYDNFMTKVATGYDMHIVAGDLFDTPTPPYSLFNWVKEINQAKERECHHIKGNHEWTDRDDDNPLFCLGLCDTSSYFPYNQESDWDIAFIPYERSPEKWYAVLDHHLHNMKDRRKIVYVVAHQWFDCFCGFDTKEMIETKRVLEIVGRYHRHQLDVHVISGHLHEPKEYNRGNLSIYSIGIPLHQSFDDVGKKCTAISIDTDSNTIEHVNLDVCDSKFVDVKIFGENEDGSCDSDKKHFYRIDIGNKDIDIDGELCMIRGGELVDNSVLFEKMKYEEYNIVPNYISNQDSPSKLNREVIGESHAPLRQEIIKETVKELSEGSDEAKKELVKLGIDLTAGGTQ